MGTEEESTDGTGIHFMIMGCTFRNNTSITPPDELGATTRLLSTFLFPGRGGGCSILMNTTSLANATVENCVFEDNSATVFGGGLYLGFSGYSFHRITVNNTKFIRNRSDSAGGLQYGFLAGLEQGDDIILAVSNSEFVENSARFGGGMLIIYAAGNVSDERYIGSVKLMLKCMTNKILILVVMLWCAISFTLGQTMLDGRLTQFGRVENCTFIRNSATEFGAAMSASTVLFMNYTGGITPVEIVDW